jgi:hypothetical protein
MSPRSAQRFWDNDMHQNKDLKRVANATRFKGDIAGWAMSRAATRKSLQELRKSK